MARHPEPEVLAETFEAIENSRRLLTTQAALVDQIGAAGKQHQTPANVITRRIINRNIPTPSHQYHYHWQETRPASSNANLFVIFQQKYIYIYSSLKLSKEYFPRQLQLNLFPEY